MTIKTDSHGGRNYIVVNAEVPIIVRPIIENETVNGMYVGKKGTIYEGKVYEVEKFDNHFGVVKSICKPKFKKGRFVKGNLIGKNYVVEVH